MYVLSTIQTGRMLRASLLAMTIPTGQWSSADRRTCIAIRDTGTVNVSLPIKTHFKEFLNLICVLSDSK